MDRYLFTEDLAEFKEQRMGDAVHKVKTLPEHEVFDPGFAAQLDRIAHAESPQIASIAPQERRGRRRTDFVEVDDLETDEFGDALEVEVALVDVSMPYYGPAETFDLAPPAGHEVDTPAHARDGKLTAIFPDDDDLERNVNEFIKLVSENLAELKIEMEGLASQIREAVHAAGKERRAQIMARKARDATLSFPID